MKYGNNVYNVDFLLDQKPPCEIEGLSKTWDVEQKCKIPTSVATGSMGDHLLGTFRSLMCTRVTHKENFICTECERIPDINSFRQRVLRKSAQETTLNISSSKINNRYLSPSHLETKLTCYREQRDYTRKGQFSDQRNGQSCFKHDQETPGA